MNEGSDGSVRHDAARAEGAYEDGQRPRRSGLWIIALILLGCALAVPLVGIFAGAFDFSLEERIEEAHVGRAKADLGAVSAALLMFRELQGRFPEDLAELMDPPPIADGQSEVYLAKPPEDPVTGRLYLYVHEGKSVRLGFLGADGVEGGTGLDEDIWVTVPRE